MKRDVRKYFEAQKPISLMKVGTEVLMNVPSVASTIAAHQRLQSGLRIVGFGVVGLFGIHSYLKG